MSDVRLSNASPTVERVDARQPENVRSVSRVLFGTPDPEEIRRLTDALQQESVQDFRDRYNYDPVMDRPLPAAAGRYIWEAAVEVPEYYRRPPHGSQRPPREEARDSPDEESRTRTESAPGSGTNGLRKRRAGASGSCSDECPKKRSNLDSGDDDDDSDCAGDVKTSSRPEDSQEVMLNAEH